MKICIIIVLATIISSLGFAAVSGSASQDQENIEKRIFELKTKRRDVLKQRVDSIQSQIDAGNTEMSSVIAARDDLYLAELELTTVKAKRIELSRKRLDNLTLHENIMRVRLENGLSPPGQKFAATAARLQAEIDLLREKRASD